MYGRVLLSLDGSELAQAGVPHAAKLAAPGGQVDVITVIPTQAMLRQMVPGSSAELAVMGGQSMDDLAASAHWEARQAAQATLERAEQELRASGVEQVNTYIREGLAGNSILDAVSEFGSEAVVMGTRGHGGLGREVLGSVAEYVLRHAGEAAVVLVGPRAHPTSASS